MILKANWWVSQKNLSIVPIKLMSLVNDKDGVWSNLGRFQQEKPWIKIANCVLYRVLYLTIILYAMRDS